MNNAFKGFIMNNVLQLVVSKEDFMMIDGLRLQFSLKNKVPIPSRSSFLKMLLFPSLERLEEDLK